MITVPQLVSREVQLTPELLVEWLAEKRIFLAFLTTQLAEAVLALGQWVIARISH